MKKAFFNKCFVFALSGVVLLGVAANPALAGGVLGLGGTGVDDVLRNVTTSSEQLPGLITGAAYLFGLLMAVLGLLKLKEHVTNPAQTPLRSGVIRLLVGGSMFALPMIYQAMATAINGGVAGVFDPAASVGGFFSALLGSITGALGTNVNGVLVSIISSFEDVPGFISAGTYLLGLILGISGILKVKDHVENPEQTGMREGVIRLLVGGSFFALPAIYNALYNTIGGAGLMGIAGSVLGTLNMFTSFWNGTANSVCNSTGGLFGGGGKLGNLLCFSVLSSTGVPAFLTAVGYLIGLIMAIWGIYKIKAHVLNPAQTGLSEGVTRLLAAGLFFALPAMVEVMRATMGGTMNGNIAALLSSASNPTTAYNETLSCSGAGGGTVGLDGVIGCMMNDVMTPILVALNFVTYVIGIVLIMIGISRLTKSAQEGPRGPGGMGTVFTFLTGGALVSYNQLMSAFTNTVFAPSGLLGLVGANPVKTKAVLQYTTGMGTAELAAAHTTISAILKFMIIVGLISFVRGIYIIRNAAEGNQQSSVMSGITHMVGGGLAVNLGGLINAVQNTLGLTGFGIVFS